MKMLSSSRLASVWLNNLYVYIYLGSLSLKLKYKARMPDIEPL